MTHFPSKSQITTGSQVHFAIETPTLGDVFARAKRGRVVEHEVEKANRRHDTTRPDPTRHGHPKSKSGTWRVSAQKSVSKSTIRNFGWSHFLFQNWRFSTKIRDLAAHFFFENWRFSTKIRDLAAHFLFENWRFSAKMRDLAAHFLFENVWFSAKMRDFAANFLFEN